jgi:hypothetical protein
MHKNPMAGLWLMMHPNSDGKLGFMGVITPA